jgi:hypothetical protein
MHEHSRKNMKPFSTTRQSVFALLLVCFLLLAGCHKDSESKKDESSGESGTAGAPADPNIVNGTGDKDAVQAVRDELNKHWLHTADGWFSEFPSKTYIVSGERAGPESFYRQFKQLNFTVEPNDLSDSDKLNGLQFYGTCQFNSPPVRLFNDPNEFGQPHWSAWHPSIESLSVQKKNGKWIVLSNGYLISGTIPAAGKIAQLK